MEELIKQISALQSELTALKLKFSVFQDSNEERLLAIEENIDRVYYVKGRVLAGQQDTHSQWVEHLICTEYEVKPYVFYKDNKRISDLETETCVLARHVLFVILNKHLGKTHMELFKKYGYHPNMAKRALENLFKSKAKEKETFERLETAVTQYLKSIRP